MAIGDNGSNNNNGGNKGLYENTYYSRIRFKNGNLALGVSFRSGLLILSIAEQQDGFKWEDLISIHLSPTKASLLADEIKKFREYYEEGNIVPGKAFGVNAGMNEKVSFIGIHADTDKNIIVTIGKFDGTGQITDRAEISLNKDYHYALEWEDISANDLAKVYYDNLEICQLANILEDFARYMNGALAYSVIDLGRYDNARILGKMDPIYDKLGIERRNNGSGGNRTNSFLDNSSRVQSTSTSIDDIL